MCSATLFHSANVLFTIAKLIGLLLVAVNVPVNQRHFRFAPSLAGFAAHVHLGMFTLNLTALLISTG